MSSSVMVNLAVEVVCDEFQTYLTSYPGVSSANIASNVFSVVHFFPSLHSESADILDFLEVARPKRNDPPGNHHHHSEINGARRPLCNGVKFTRAFLLEVGAEPSQRVVELAADFAGAIEVRE